MAIVPDENVDAFAAPRLPAASDRRLQSLVDGGNRDGRLTAGEQAEPEALVEISEAISLARADAVVAGRARIDGVPNRAGACRPGPG